jgi:short-subunit dehydrogenase
LAQITLISLFFTAKSAQSVPNNPNFVSIKVKQVKNVKSQTMEKKKGLALITGASQGIGAAIAMGLAQDGYRPVLIARNRLNLLKVSGEIMNLGDNVPEPIVLPLDITDYAKIDEEIKDINQRYGAIDILVNAAAMYMDGSLNEPVDNFKKIIETNVVAQYSVLKTVTEIMKAQPGGYIFNIASRAAKYGFPGGGIYGSTKFAFVGLTESLYRELAPAGIRITSLCPGWVNTGMAKDAGTPLSDEEMIQPDDLLNTIRYLLNLSENVCIKEIVLEMKKSII